jgi:Zn-finger nucleic acid-binding protein
MRTYERNGVHVDQCADCRGIFLDRGELDRLIDAETAWHGTPAAASVSQDSAPPRSEQPPARQSGHQSAVAGAGLSGVVGEVLRQVQGSKQSGHQSGYGHRRKKESFLSDLFG